MALFQKKKSDFCEMLHAQSQKVLEGLDALYAWSQGGVDTQREKVKDSERQADELRRIVIEELNQTFVTPFDRDDIFSLSRAIDDVMDYADRTVDEMEIYEVKPYSHVVQMIDILRKSARELSDAIRLIQKYPNIALEHATRGDFALLEHALSNLLINAALHTPPKTPIRVGILSSAEHLTISVLDSGPGIAPHAIGRVFEKFYRVEGTPSGGTGLGLPIARGFIEAHGGTLTASNRASGGTEMTIALPLKEKPVA